MTNNQNKLIAVVMAAKETEDYNTRNRGVALFGHWHRIAESLQAVPVPLFCIENLGEHNYYPYALPSMYIIP